MGSVTDEPTLWGMTPVVAGTHHRAPRVRRASDRHRHRGAVRERRESDPDPATCVTQVTTLLDYGYGRVPVMLSSPDNMPLTRKTGAGAGSRSTTLLYPVTQQLQRRPARQVARAGSGSNEVATAYSVMS